MKLKDLLKHTSNHIIVVVQEELNEVAQGHPCDLERKLSADRLNQTFGLVMGTREVNNKYSLSGVSDAVVVSILPRR